MLKAKGVDKSKAVMYDCNFRGSVEEYAMMWLNLTNNARENNDDFLKITNDSANGVYVYVSGNTDKTEMKRYLEGIGLEICDEYSVSVIRPVYYYDKMRDVYCGCDEVLWLGE